MARVMLHHNKGTWTLAEVEGLCLACRYQGAALPPQKGIWTQQEVATLLKGKGHRVWSGDTRGANFMLEKAVEPKKREREEVS